MDIEDRLTAENDDREGCEDQIIQENERVLVQVCRVKAITRFHYFTCHT